MMFATNVCLKAEKATISTTYNNHTVQMCLCVSDITMKNEERKRTYTKFLFIKMAWTFVLYWWHQKKRIDFSLYQESPNGVPFKSIPDGDIENVCVLH